MEQTSGMIRVQGVFHEFFIDEHREIVETDSHNYPWIEDSAGYFLVRIDNDMLSCGFVQKGTLRLELRGKDPIKIIKEIARRDLCSNAQHMGYIAAELMIAKRCLDESLPYEQR